MYNYYDKIPDTGSHSSEEMADILFCKIVTAVFEDFKPGDYLTEIDFCEPQYNIISQTQGGLEGFRDRVFNVLEATVEDLSTFNGKPTSAKTKITLIFDINYDEKDTTGFPYTFMIWLRREENDGE